MKANAKFTCRVCGFKGPQENTECPICCTKNDSAKKTRASKKSVAMQQNTRNSTLLGPRLVEKLMLSSRRRKSRKPKERRKLLHANGILLDQISNNIDETIEKELPTAKNTIGTELDTMHKESKDAVCNLSSSFLSQTNGSSLGDQLASNRSTLFRIKSLSFLKTNSTETLNQSSYVLSNATESVSRIFECIPPPKLLLNRPAYDLQR